MKIRKYKKVDLEEVANLIYKTFKKFNSNEKTKGVEEYSEFYTPRKENLYQINKQFSKSNIFLVAENNEQIIGLIRGNKERISNLFVGGDYHKKGIGTKLIIAFEKEALKNNSKLIKAAVQPYAIPFYLKMGYKKTTGIRIRYGLKIQPMQKRLK